MKQLGKSVIVVCLLAAVACGRGEKASKEEISETLREKGTTEVLKAAADDKYDAPADGKLTEAQVEMYLKVREREKEIARVARTEAESHAKKAEAKGEKSIGGMMEAFKTLGSVADLATADIRAAQELGVNTAEYQWVKMTILAVSSAEVSQQIASTTGAMMDANYARLKKQHDEATDETTKRALADAIAQYDKARGDVAEKAEGEPKDAAYAHNKDLITKYDGAINALATELSKYTTESAPDLSKQLSDLQKAAEQAAQESTK